MRNYRQFVVELEETRKMAIIVLAQIGYADLDTELVWELIEKIVDLRDAAAKKAGITDLRVLR